MARQRNPPEDAHLAGIREEEATIERLEEDSNRLRFIANQALAGTDTSGGYVRLREGIAQSQAGWYLVITLALFLAADQILGFVFSVMGPEIRNALGLSEASYGIIVSQRANAAAGVALSMAANLHRRASLRRLLVMQAALGTGIGAVASAFSASFWPLFFAVGLSGPTAGVAWAIHRPMVMDAYVPQVRVRVMSLHQSGIVVGAVLAPALVALLAGPFGLSWRGVLLITGGAATVIALAGLRLPDAVPGRHDTDRARSAVREELESTATSHQQADLKFGETIRKLWLIPTVRTLLAAWAVLGVVITPLFTYMSFFLADRWQMNLTGRSTFIAVAWAFALPGLFWIGRHGDEKSRATPARLVSVSAALLAVLAVGLVVTATAPFLGVALVGFGVVLAASAMVIPALMVSLFSIVAPETRPHAGSLVAVFLVVVGGQGGGMLLAGLDRRYGPATAIGFLAAPALAAAWLARRASVTVADDLGQFVEEVVEEEEVRALLGQGKRLPMLSCRHVDFAYGQLQVLFDVNFTVDDGEIVALLGTNGAGKSTLLRVISGLGLPSRGSVRFEGADITYLDAERRVGLGVSQIPGGRAVFGPMTVADNLRVLGYSHGRNRMAVERGIEASFDAFPRLAERRNQLASTLSGGEQQMLGLATAFILRPRLLLIDELSLGLAPKVVGELLDIVRRINADGTAIVLVEQSVNVALSVVNHAYFMEKGEIRFDGKAADILSRPDLLRSVFLEGASKSLAATRNGR